LEGMSIILDITIIFIAALGGGLIAERLKQSPLIGYILGGIMVGPYVTGLVSNLQMVNSLADIGIILLMFTLGIEFSLKRLEKVKNIALWGGALQIAVVVIVGIGAGHLIGLNLISSVFLGCILSISSTMIVLRVLGDEGELDSLHGQIMLGILIVQDLAVILMVSVLPNLPQLSAGNALKVFTPLAIALVVVILMLYLAQKAVPVMMRRAAQASNNDVFLLFALSMGLGVSLLSEATGLSLTLGAFLAGILISESDYAHEIMGKILSLRDAFVIVFFVSVGMLVNPARLFTDIVPLIKILFVIIPVKFLVFFVIVKLFKYHSRVAFTVGTGMMQIGEFSFVMARLGLEKGLISESLYNLILASALISIILTPVFMRKSGAWLQRIQEISWLKGLFPQPVIEESVMPQGLSGHIILCGYGRMGKNVLIGLKHLNLPVVVIDYDHTAINDLSSQGIPCVYGDASSKIVLEHVAPEQALGAIITLPDALISRQAILSLKQLNPGLFFLARAHNPWQTLILREAGATEVIIPEAEAGFQMIRHMILNLDLPLEKVNRFLEQLFYVDYQKISKKGGYDIAKPVRIKEFKISPLSSLVGLTLRDSNIRESSGCNVVTIKKRNGEIIFNPSSRETIEPGDILVVMGDDVQLSSFFTMKKGDSA
jgi:CPA2 family monovalent cation:H+ antiporter-2